jgi:hypothetical protein
VHAEQPTRQPAHHSPGHHQGAKTPAETGRSGASTRSCMPSTPSSRSYHSARERRGTPTRPPACTLMQLWLNAATILCWLLSSIFVLSLANLARSV